MKYEEIAPMDREQAGADAASGDAERTVYAVLAVALHEPEREWAERFVLGLSSHDDPAVRRAAALGVGHIARIHRAIDPRFIPVLKRLALDPKLEGAADDALEDIRIFVRRRR